MRQKNSNYLAKELMLLKKIFLFFNLLLRSSVFAAEINNDILPITKQSIETFNAITQLYSIANLIKIKLKKKDENLNIKVNWNFPNKLFGTTQEGIFLNCDSTDLKIYSPWGELNLLTFESKTSFSNSMFEVLSILKKYIKYTYIAYYTLHEVNGIKLPEPKVSFDKNFSENKLMINYYALLFFHLAELKLNSMQNYFSKKINLNFLIAWHLCNSNADKIAVYEHSLQFLKNTVNLRWKVTQYIALRILLTSQNFLDYIMHDLIQRIEYDLDECYRSLELI